MVNSMDDNIDNSTAPPMENKMEHSMKHSMKHSMDNLPEEYLSNLTGLEIAVVGMAGRFPGAPNVRVFWENIKNGVESIAFFSDEELAEAGVSPQLLSNPNYVKARGYLDAAEYFDASFFGYPPVEACIMDPQLRFFHECTWEALEDAGCVPETVGGSIGVYFGASDNLNWRGNVLMSGESTGSMFVDSLFNNKDLFSSRLSYLLNLSGPSCSINSACSTSLVAIHLASRGLLGGECDIALAGGASITMQQKDGYVYQEGMIESPDGHCRSFDAEAGGTVFGSGIGLVVLKRLEDAVEGGNHIYAVIKGSAVNNDGRQKVGYTAPGVDGQAGVIETALQVAEVEAESIDYIETHGTATALGDSVEIKALVRGLNRDKNVPCPIGSVKPNVGHLDCAAGVAGFIKTVLALKNRVIPPTLHFKSPNPALGVEETPFYVNAALTPFTNKGRLLRAGISSFGIGGTNAHVIVEEAPEMAVSAEAAGVVEVGRKVQLLPLSARTGEALQDAAKNLALFLQSEQDMSLRDMAYTLQTGRKGFSHRGYAVCGDAAEAVEILSDPASSKFQVLAAEKEYRHMVFLFSGQGSQYVDMGRELYEKERIFRDEMDRCFKLLLPIMAEGLRRDGLSSLNELLYPGEVAGDVSGDVSSNVSGDVSGNVSGDVISNISGDVSGDVSGDGKAGKEELLNRTEYTQPLLFAFLYALAKQLIHWGIKPDVMMGYSFGEYVAACLAGVFTLEEGLRLVVLRGRLMQGLPVGAMLSVPMPEEQLRRLLKGHLSIAIVNEPACIVAGPPEEIDALEEEMKGRRLMCMRLNTTFAAHSALMDNAVADFEAQLRRISFKEPQTPIISGITTEWLTAEEATDYRYWLRHLRETIRFSGGIRRLLKEKESIFLEIGPGRDLSVLVKRYMEMDKQEQPVLNLIRPQKQKVSDTRYLLSRVGRLWLLRQKIDWTAFHGAGALLSLTSLPTYPFQRKKYWVDGSQARAAMFAGGGVDLLAKQRDMGDWFYVPTWKRSGLAGEAVTENHLPATALVFAHHGGLGDTLAGVLEQAGVDTVVVHKEKQFTAFSRNRYAMHPLEGDHYDRLMTDLRRQKRKPGWIFHTWSVTGADFVEGKTGENASTAPSMPLSQEKLDSAQETGYFSLLHLVRAIGKQDFAGDSEIRLAVVSDWMQQVASEPLLCPEKATILGAVGVIPQEYPFIRCISVDIDSVGDSHGQKPERG